MGSSYSKWSDVRARGRAVDPRSPPEMAEGKALAKERHQAYFRGPSGVVRAIGLGGSSPGRSSRTAGLAPPSPSGPLGRRPEP